MKNQNNIARLSTEELRVVKGIAEGSNVKSLALLHGVSRKTIYTELNRAYAKLYRKYGTDFNPQLLAHWAIRYGLIEMKVFDSKKPLIRNAGQLRLPKMVDELIAKASVR